MVAVCTLLAGAACGEGPGAAGDAEVPERRGASLVVGTSLERRALLVVPHGGGPATLRALATPGDSLWGGATELPPAVDARPLGATAILLGEDGVVHRYVPDRDLLTEVDRVSPGASWTSAAGHGVYADGEGAVQVSPEGSWSYEFPGPVRWAAPVAEGGLVALLQSADEAALRIYEPGAGEPSGRAAGVDTPALVTAWGTRLAFGGPGEAVVLLTVPQLVETARWPLPGTAVAMASSPSTHRIYVGLEGTGEVVAVDRFSGEVDRLAELEGTVVDLRPAVFGGALLVATDSGVWHLDVDGGHPLPVPTEWRADLPLGLPDARVLVVEDGRVGVWSPGDAVPTPLEAPADAWWLPVEWRPVPPPALARAAAGAARERTAAEPAAADPDLEESPEGAGPEGAEEEAGPGAGAPDAGDAAPAGGEAEAGYYAIVSSSQSMSGIEALVENLSEAGYPASVQRHRDEAAELWYRVLVGPYEDRDRAEEAARRLRRERGLEAWISEVGPDARPVDEGGPGL